MFWRILAGLMLVVIGWVVWVAYQITPRSLVTPLAYAGPKAMMPATAPGSQGGAQAAILPAANAAAVPAGIKEGAIAATGSGAQQSADTTAAAGSVTASPAATAHATQDEGLKMATKISTLPDEKAENPSVNEKKTSGPVTAASSGSASARP